MSNGDNRPRDRDDDDDLYQQQLRTVRTPVQTLPTTPAAPTGYTAAQIPPMPTTPAAKPTRLEHLKSEYQDLWEKTHPEKKTGWGRFGQVMGTIGQDIGVAMAPEVMANVPGTDLNRRLRLSAVGQTLGEEEQRAAAREEAKQRTGLERERIGFEESKYGIPTPVTGELGESLTVYKPGTNQPESIPYQWAGHGIRNVPVGETPPRNWPGEAPTTLPSTGAAPAAPPGGAPPIAAAPGMPQTPQAPPRGAQPQPIMGGMPTITPAPPTAGRYGKLGPGQLPMTADEIAQQNAANAAYWKRLEPDKPFPREFTLGPQSSKDDAARIDQTLKSMETAGGLQAQREYTQELGREREQRAAAEQQQRKETADEKMVRAVDNDGKVHLMSRGDYEAHKQDYHPNPFGLVPGEYDKVVDHNTVLNEMQGRMNAFAQSVRRFDWSSGQQKLVMQAMEQADKNYPDQVIGIPIMRFVADNLKQLGLEGANPQTREYIIDLLSLREALLGLPKEITGGSRMMEKSVEALWATLPSGVTPDQKWAMTQLRATQSIIDRLRGSRVPIVDGMTSVPKIPDLYQYSATNAKTKQQIYSDDKRNWVDEDGKPVR